MVDEVQVRFGANIAGLVAGVEGVKEQLEGLASFTSSLTSTFTGLGEAFLAIFAVEQIESFIEKIVESGVDLNRMEVQLGATAQQVNVLKLAAEQSDTQISLLSRTIAQFARIAEEAATGTGHASEAFKAMGIDVAKQIQGGASLNDIFEETVKKLYTYSDSLDKTALMSMTMGGRSTQLAMAIKQLGGNYKEMDETVRRSGETIEGFDKAAQNTKEKTSEASAATAGFTEQLYMHFKPAIDSVVEAYSHLTENLNESLQSGAIGAAIDYGLILPFKGLATVVATVGLIVESLGAKIEELVAKGTVEVDILSKYFEQLWYIITHRGSSSDGITEEIKNLKVAQADADQEFLKGQALRQAAFDKYLATLWNLDSAQKQVNQGGGTDAPHTAGTAGIQTQMEKWQQALTEMLLQKQAFGQQAELIELQYWQNILATANLGAKERGEIEKKIYDLESRLHQQSVRDTDAALKQEQKSYEQFFASFNSGIIGMIHGTGTWRDAVKGAFDHVAEWGLKRIEQLVAKWIVGETSKQAASAATATAITAQQAAAAAAQGVAMKASAIGSITTDAAETFGGIFAFLSPYMGPAAAGPAAAGQASVMAQLGNVASFDVGSWGVPHDMVANLHAGERVLTASENLYGTGGGGSGGVTLQINGGINDAKSIRDLIMREGPALKKSMQRQAALSHSKAIK